MPSCNFWSTRLAPASDKYPSFSTRQPRPKQHGQHIFCIHLVHFGFSWPYGSSSFGLNTPTVFCQIPTTHMYFVILCIYNHDNIITSSSCNCQPVNIFIHQCWLINFLLFATALLFTFLLISLKSLKGSACISMVSYLMHSKLNAFSLAMWQFFLSIYSN